MKRQLLPVLLPLMAVLFVVVWGGGLGVSFILLNKTSLGEWAVIILGMALVVGVPAIATLLSLPRQGPPSDSDPYL